LDKSKINNESNERGPLSGEYTYNNLRRTLRNYMVSEVTGVISGNPKMLSEIGITPDANGNMSISNVSKFNDAATSNVQKISDLFNLSDGVAEKIGNLLENYVIYGGIVDDNKSYIDIKVGSVERQIIRLEERLSRKEVYYRRQFAMMQDMLSAISTQQSITQKFLGSSNNFNLLA
jgi:flagellar capping protein FliD